MSLRLGVESTLMTFYPFFLFLWHASIVPLESVVVKDNLTYEEEPVEILDRQVRRLRDKEVASMKVLWTSQSDYGLAYLLVGYIWCHHDLRDQIMTVEVVEVPSFDNTFDIDSYE
ncbi:hypothetical protein MTR67_003150 [Solanum verrucosum]|uniref:Uncharacterized protein n=1 Tax=Solanum verrucosum TaxID=315347 RepID=A0AAF0PV24_SOLVR|nr:hypothetical protein MTR67_003150 [Solanum verrucosum]